MELAPEMFEMPTVFEVLTAVVTVVCEMTLEALMPMEVHSLTQDFARTLEPIMLTEVGTLEPIMLAEVHMFMQDFTVKALSLMRDLELELLEF